MLSDSFENNCSSCRCVLSLTLLFLILSLFFSYRTAWKPGPGGAAGQKHRKRPRHLPGRYSVDGHVGRFMVVETVRYAVVQALNFSIL